MKSIPITRHHLNSFPSQKNQCLRGMRDTLETTELGGPGRESRVVPQKLLLEERTCWGWRESPPHPDGRVTKETAGSGSSPLGHSGTESPDIGSFRPLSLNFLSLQGTGRESLLPGVGEAWSMKAAWEQRTACQLSVGAPTPQIS